MCTNHHNVDLQLQAIGSKFSLEDVMSLLVCNMTNQDCMLRTCKKCPKEDKVHQILTDLFDRRSSIASSFVGSDGGKESEENDGEDKDELIKFKQWVSTDRTELITRSLPKSKFFKYLCSALHKLLPLALPLNNLSTFNNSKNHW